MIHAGKNNPWGRFTRVSLRAGLTNIFAAGTQNHHDYDGSTFNDEDEDDADDEPNSMVR